MKSTFILSGLLLILSCTSRTETSEQAPVDAKVQDTHVKINIPPPDDSLIELAKGAKKLRKSSSAKEQEAGKAIQDLLSQAPNPPLPLWDEGDFEWHKTNLNIMATTVYNQPPFYKEAVPLEYNVGTSPGGILLLHDFGDFRNLFRIRESSMIIIGARTLDKQNNLVAECRVKYYAKNGQQGIGLEEFHYDAQGNVIFRCKSEIDANSGFKTQEGNQLGQKRKDFYFIWPKKGDAVDNNF